MANLTITKANVIPGTGAGFLSDKAAGEALGTGEDAYLAADNKLYKCDANDTEIKAQCRGIVIGDFLTGQPVLLVKNGPVAFGAILTKGIKYCLSRTAGLICPQSDLVTDDYVTELGYATSTTTLQLAIVVTGLKLA